MHYVSKKNIDVEYVEAHHEMADVRKLIPHLSMKGVKELHFIDPVDDWLTDRIVKTCHNHKISCHSYRSPAFILDPKDLECFFNPQRDNYFQANFYKLQRKKFKILLDEDEQPLGGKWSFDSENRKKYPVKKLPPRINWPEIDGQFEEGIAYVENNFSENIGQINRTFRFPYTFDQAEIWLSQFLEHRFEGFGTFEDAIVSDEIILHHSLLSPLINVGLLEIRYVLDSVLEFAREHDVPINSVEGFIRQIIGWREFIRGVYLVAGRKERVTNFWRFNRRIPSSFYDGSTGILPVDNTIRKVLETGYCHHIERLMILGNFMLLCEFGPDDVYQWFMELFIDAYDWVMVPNVYGMSQFADGGMMSTKPYISGSNYILKMSDYDKGDWIETWDGLFWRFMFKQRAFFESNPRMSLLLGTWDKMDKEKKSTHLRNASLFLESLEN